MSSNPTEAFTPQMFKQLLTSLLAEGNARSYDDEVGRLIADISIAVCWDFTWPQVDNHTSPSNDRLIGVFSKSASKRHPCDS
eukprot:5187472-Amphidinium_carterae.1